MKKPFNSLSASVNKNILDPDQAWRFSQTVLTKIGLNNLARPDLDPNRLTLKVFLFFEKS